MSAKAIAIIPARGGSKGIPKKNLQTVGGVSLVGRSIQTCLACPSVEAVVVSTDDLEIAAEARKYGAEVISRPAEMSTDTASSESALLHALEELASVGRKPAVTVFVQPTSPFLISSELEEAISRVATGEKDVVFSAFQTFAFLWKLSGETAEGVNHDSTFRPRRQDREPHFQETGGFYVMNTDKFMEAKFRFFGAIGIQEVSEDSSLEIDDQSQLTTARHLASLFKSAKPAAGEIKALVMDFDGVHTDDRATVDSNGVESVTVSRSDGMGIEMLKNIGLPMLILSKETNSVVKVRAAKLGIEVSSGQSDKLPALRDWCESKGIDLSDVAYIGNDINDIECLKAVGWPITPKDANPILDSLSRIHLERRGGHGAIRELAELILGR